MSAIAFQPCVGLDQVLVLLRQLGEVLPLSVTLYFVVDGTRRPGIGQPAGVPSIAFQWIGGKFGA